MVTKDELVKAMHRAVDDCFDGLADSILNNCDQNVMLKQALHEIDKLRAEVHTLREALAKTKLSA